MTLLPKTRWLFALAAALGVLLAVQRAGRAVAPDALPTLPDVAAADVVKVTIATLVDQIVLEKAEQSWRETVPLQVDADAAAASALVAALTGGVRMDAQLDRGNLEAYGVDDQHALNVQLWTGGETSALGLMIGGNAGPGAVFVRLLGDDRVFRAPIGNRARFDRTAEGWRDRAVLDLADEHLRAFTLTRADGTTLRLTRTDGAWVRDDGGEADPALLARLVRTFGTLRAVQFHHAGYEGGFEPPLATAVLEDDAGVVHRVVVGRASDARGALVRVDDRAEVVRVAAQVARIAAVTDADLADRRAFRFEPAQVRGISLTEAGLTVELAPAADGGGWAIVRPANMAADQEQIVRAVRSLAELRVLGAAPDAAFTPTGGRLEIELLDGRRQTLRFGQRDGKIDGREVVRVRVDGRAEVLRLPLDGLVELRRALGRG